VHLAAIGHPVLADPVYGRVDPRCPRPFLHAAELGLAHPVTGESMRFGSPLPPDLEAVLVALGPER
jgi:23S rRNA pseudouridine1911/1915/1917 synthase